MKLNLSKLLDGSIYKVSFDEQLDLNSIKIKGREIKFTKPVLVKGEVYKTEEGLYSIARVEYEYLENCSRCLEEFNNKIETEFSGKVVEKSKDYSSEQEDEDFVIYYDGKEVDIRDTIINSILLSIPMKSLCKIDCKGLCPKCGKNLNESQCNCIIDEVDPRLAKLKELFD